MSPSSGSSDPDLLIEFFERAVALTPDQRDAYLKRHSSQHPMLIEEVRDLLAQDEQGTKEYLISPVSPTDPVRAEAISRLLQPVEVPECIGDYRIVRVLGRGGMGTVYLAEQPGPDRRKVALKIMRPAGSAARVMRRFEQERQVLARMDHTNICRILDTGTTENGLPYFVMEFVEDAKSLTRYARDEELGLRERLELLLPICRAVSHGHSRGILHRDLKPSNVLAGRDGVPKLIDFGVARSLEADAETATRMTEVGQLMGTLQYMCPEQFDGRELELDERSDVYSLGVLLYELLTEQLPYDVAGRSLLDAAHIIQEKAPTRPSVFVPELRGDLETIVLQALDKEPARRYSSASELALDIERYLRSEEIQARPARRLHQLRLFARRNKGLTAGLLMTALALIFGALFSTALALKAVRARQQAEDLTNYLTKSLEATNPYGQGEAATLQGLLERMASTVELEFDGRPETVGRVLTTIANAYSSLGDLRAAETHLNRAGVILESELGRDHPDWLRARASMGALLLDQGRDDEAERVLVECTPALGRVLGSDHPVTLGATLSLGWLFQEQYRYDEAEAALKRAAAGFERLRGEEHLDTLTAKSSLGSLYVVSGRRELGWPLLEHVSEMEREHYGRNRSTTLGTLAYLHESEQHWDQAELLYEQALETNKEILGEEDPRTLDAIYNLAVFYSGRQRFDQAEELLLAGLEQSRLSSGEQHPRTLDLANSLGRVFLQQGRPTEALPYLEQAVEGLRELGTRVVDLGLFLIDCGVGLTSLGRHEDAELVLLEAYDCFVVHLGESTNEASLAATELVHLYEEWGREAMAREWRGRSQPLDKGSRVE